MCVVIVAAVADTMVVLVGKLIRGGRTSRKSEAWMRRVMDGWNGWLGGESCVLLLYRGTADQVVLAAPFFDPRCPEPEIKSTPKPAKTHMILKPEKCRFGRW